MVDKDKKEVKYNEKREDEIDEEENTPNDEDNFGLNPPYEEIDSETVYKDEKRIGKVFGVNDTTKDEKFIRLLSKSYKYDKNDRKNSWKANSGFNLYNHLQVNHLIVSIRKIASKIGWRIRRADQIKLLQIEIQEKEQLIADYKINEQRIREDYEETLSKYVEKIKELGKNKLPDFKRDIKVLEKMIEDFKTQKIPEKNLQEYLYTHSWLFGLEYLNAESQKLRGAHSKFDFYLERFNRTNDIVEIKLISDKVINDDSSISSKVVQAVDQLIEYMESSTSAAYSSVISEEEGIKELRPRGIVVIGSNISKTAKEKLQKWNYQLAHIRIITYEDLLEQGRTAIKNIEG
jgi:hypothetical protein